MRDGRKNCARTNGSIEHAFGVDADRLEKSGVPRRKGRVRASDISEATIDTDERTNVRNESGLNCGCDGQSPRRKGHIRASDISEAAADTHVQTNVRNEDELNYEDDRRSLRRRGRTGASDISEAAVDADRRTDVRSMNERARVRDMDEMVYLGDGEPDGFEAAAARKRGRSRPAVGLEARENQLISLAVDLVEQRLRDGSATSQEVTHFLKLATSKSRLETEILKCQKDLITAKTESIRSASRVEELYSEAINALKRYGGGAASGSAASEDDANGYG